MFRATAAILGGAAVLGYAVNAGVRPPPLTGRPRNATATGPPPDPRNATATGPPPDPRNATATAILALMRSAWSGGSDDP